MFTTGDLIIGILGICVIYVISFILSNYFHDNDNNKNKYKQSK